MEFVSQEAGACAFDVIEGSWARLVSWISSGPPQKLGAIKPSWRRDGPTYVAGGWCCNPKESAMERSGRHLR